MTVFVGIVGLILIAIVVIDIVLTNMALAEIKKFTTLTLEGQRLTLENMQRTFDRERRTWEEHRSGVEREVQQIRMGAPINYKLSDLRESLNESQRTIARISWPTVYEHIQEDVDE